MDQWCSVCLVCLFHITKNRLINHGVLFPNTNNKTLGSKDLKHHSSLWFTYKYKYKAIQGLSAKHY